MVKEQEGGEECVPFRMLNSACGSVLSLFSYPPIKYQLSYCKGKISTLQDQYGLGSLTLTAYPTFQVCLKLFTGYSL